MRCLAEGEGRNAVHLAVLGHAVTAVDQSAIGLAKAARLGAVPWIVRAALALTRFLIGAALKLGWVR